MAISTRKPILTSGGGLSSLPLAPSLRCAAIPFLIFEKDSSISFRAQGYRLRLSSEGIDAIELSPEPAAFQTFWDTCRKTGGSGFTANSNIFNLFQAPLKTTSVRRMLCSSLIG